MRRKKTTAEPTAEMPSYPTPPMPDMTMNVACAKEAPRENPEARIAKLTVLVFGLEEARFTFGDYDAVSRTCNELHATINRIRLGLR